MLTVAQRRVLTVRYQTQLDRTATMLGAHAQDAWNRLGSWDEPDMTRLATQLQPVAHAARAHAAVLAAGFVALAAELPILPVEPDTATDWSPAFHAYWKSLTNQPWADAIVAGANAVEAVGFDAVQSSARDATRQIDEREPRITGWQRIPDGGACTWCLEVAGATYHTAESADFGHDRCGCTVAPAD